MRLRIIFTTAFLICIAVGAIAADSGAISGVVRDEQGNPAVSATVTITNNQTPPASSQTKTGSAGEYSFTGLAVGDYIVEARLSGYTSASSPVHLSSASTPVKADLTLTPSAPSPTSTPQFQAAGIHGLIDPGGYSASASVDAASGILRGMADVTRTDRNFGTSTLKDWPCSLEPELEEAIAAHPNQAEANRRLGQFYVAHDQPSRAIPLLRRAVQIDGTDYAASRDLAIAFMQGGQFDEARKLLTALAERHNEAEVHQLLARADEGSGIFPQAAQEYRTANKEQPSEESLFGVGYELVLSGSVADALTVFEAGERNYPRSILLKVGAGTAQFLLSHPADAVRSFLEVTDLDPADPRPYAFLAAASGISRDEAERVRNSFKRYLNRAPDSAAANYFYALVLSRDNADTDASREETLLKRAIQLDPGMAKAHLLLADIYGRRNDYADAVPEYESAVRLAPALSEAHYRLAIALKRAGRAQKSEQEMQLFRQAKEKQSGNVDIDIAQFVSVIDTPAQRNNAETQCRPSIH